MMYKSFYTGIKKNSCKQMVEIDQYNKKIEYVSLNQL